MSRKELAYLFAEFGEGLALVREGLVVHYVPVHHIHLILGHSLLHKKKSKTLYKGQETIYNTQEVIFKHFTITRVAQYSYTV